MNSDTDLQTTSNFSLKIHKVQKYILNLIILIIPLHTLLVYRLLGQYFPFAQYWKEVLISLLTLLYLLSPTQRIKFKFTDFAVIAFSGYCIGLAMIQPGAASIYGVRNYVQPLILLFLVNKMSFQKTDFENIVKGVLIVGFIICIWALFQAYVLGDDFLIGLGYYENQKYSRLHHSFYIAGGTFQRAVGTLSSPTVFAFYLLILICILIQQKSIFKRQHYWALFSIFHITLLATFSRSSILALFIVYFFFFPRILSKLVIMAILAITFGFIFCPPLREIILIFYTFIEMTLQFRDPSTVGHLDSILKATDLIKQYYISGIGIGSLGPLAAKYTGELLNVENSFICILLDCGLFGLLFYTILWFSICIYRTAIPLVAGFIVAASFLPLIYALEPMLLLTGLLGILINTSKRSLNTFNAAPVTYHPRTV